MFIKTLMNRHNTLLFFLITAHFFIFLLAGLFRYWGNITSINDVGVWDQAVWGLLNGEPFLNTIHFNEGINWLAVHFHPVLTVFAPFYLIDSSPFWFTLAQSMALSLAAWPIFILGKIILDSEKGGLIWATIYLVNPFLLNADAWDFHPISLAVPFVALGLLAVVTKNFRLMGVSVFVILLCKEHLGIMVVGFGALWWIKNRQWKPGLLLVLIGMVHFYAVLKIIMPALSPTGQHVMLSEGLGQLSRYTWLGQSLGEIISFVISNPLHVLKTVLFEIGGLSYLALLLIPFLFFPLIGLLFLFPGMADLATNMLSANPLPRGVFTFHSVTLIPVFTVAAMYGVKIISRRVKRFSINELSVLVLFASFFMGYLLAPFPLPGAKNIWAPISFVSLPDPRIKEIDSLVGKEAAISVQANIGAHFSQRKEIYRFPNKIADADAVVLWLESPTENVHNYPDEEKNSKQFMVGMLDSHLQMDRDDFLKSIQNLLADKDFGVVYWNDPWLVLKRGKPHQQDITEIEIKLETLHDVW